jgi:DNA-binding NarL/FixJ family response regulator
MLPPEPVIRVLVADSHEMSRYGMAVFLETFDDLKLVGEAQDGAQVLRMCDQLQPNVVLMSVNLQFLNGENLIQHIREQFSHIRVIMLSAFNNPRDLQQALDSGASSFLIKGETNIYQIAEAIREANN